MKTTIDQEDRHRGDCGPQLRNLGIPRRGTARRALSDRDTRFTSALWTSLHEALGASLGSPHHHNTTCKVERVNGVIADVLRSFARGPETGATTGRTW